MSSTKKKFDPAELSVVCEQWITGSIERIDGMSDSGASVIDIRDACLFISGCLCGYLQACGIPMLEVNKRVADFQTSLDGHLLEILPEVPPGVWNHNVPPLQ